MNQEKLNKMVKEVDFFSPYIIGNDRFIFNKEVDFANFVEEWDKMLYEREIREEEALALVFVNNLTNLNWEEVWFNINEKIINNNNKFIFDFIMKNISFNSFAKKINECDDVELVYDFYKLFGEINKISFSELQDKYALYLDEAIKKNNSSYEEMLSHYFNHYHSDSVNDLICMMMKKADLNYVVKDYFGESLPLKDYIATSLTFDNGHDSDKIIKSFLNSNSDMYFENNIGNLSDKCLLNMLIGNYDEAMKIFNSDEYQLNSLEQMDSLLINRSYELEDDEKFIDRLFGIVAFNNNKSILLKILYSDKVKMIDASYLGIIKNKLGDEEYEKFMKHVNENNIQIFYEYEDNEYGNKKIMISNDLNDTLSYLYNKAYEKKKNERVLSKRIVKHIF